MHNPELSLVIPCYNEEKNIRGIAEQLTNVLKEEKIDYELILVNNGSSDSTPQTLEELSKEDYRITVAHIQKNEGYGWGIITGLRKAHGKYVGFLDGDDQIPTETVVKVFQKLKSEELDLCKTRRVEREDGPIRVSLSKLYGIALFFLFFIWINDINGKPKIMKSDCWKELRISSKDWFIDTEIMLKSRRKKYKIDEVSTRFERRKHGKSHIKYGIIFEFLKNCMKFRLMGERLDG